MTNKRKCAFKGCTNRDPASWTIYDFCHQGAPKGHDDADWITYSCGEHAMRVEPTFHVGMLAIQPLNEHGESATFPGTKLGYDPIIVHKKEARRPASMTA